MISKPFTPRFVEIIGWTIPPVVISAGKRRRKQKAENRKIIYKNVVSRKQRKKEFMKAKNPSFKKWHPSWVVCECRRYYMQTTRKIWTIID